MWCTIINGGLLILWTLSWMLTPDLIFRLQTRWFPITRDAYNVVFYCFVGLQAISK